MGLILHILVVSLDGVVALKIRYLLFRGKQNIFLKKKRKQKRGEMGVEEGVFNTTALSVTLSIGCWL